LIINLFRNNRPSVYVLLLIYTFALRGFFLAHPAFENPPAGSFLSPYIANWIQSNNISNFSLQLADILLIYFEAIILNFILTANNIFTRSSFIPAMIFVTLSSLFGEWIKGSAQTVAQLFLLISLMNLFSITGKDPSRENVFYTALFLSIGSLFYFPVSLFLVVIILGIILRSLSFADLMLVLIGFLLPYYFIGVGAYYTGALPDYLHFLQMHLYINLSPAIDISIAQEIMLLYILVLVVFGYFQLQADREFKIVKHRRLVLIVLGYFILSALAGPFIAGSKLLYIQLIVLPATIFVSQIFSTSKLKIWHHLLFLVLFFGVVSFELDFLNIIHW
jgi:hypothetical protein